jgi:hypothetical protein
MNRVNIILLKNVQSVAVAKIKKDKSVEFPLMFGSDYFDYNSVAARNCSNQSHK